jgi:hypothetical protein
MPDQETSIRTYTQMLQDGLNEVVAGEPFRRFLRFLANNPNYSHRNVLLILQQMPEATRTKGFKGWLKEGRCVREGQRGIRINANFQRNDEEDLLPPDHQKQKEEKRTFRRISVFDISQTVALEGEEDKQAASMPYFGPVDPFAEDILDGQVEHYDLALRLLHSISPLPVTFQQGLRVDGEAGNSEILIKSGMSQLHTIRTILNHMVQVWRGPFCWDQDQLEIEAESVAFIVCQYLGLDTSNFSIPHIAKHSFGQERKRLERFLDAIQQTALYLIDSIDGLLEAQKIGYEVDGLFLLTNQRTALRLFREQRPVYLVFPGEGELLTMSKKAIEEHKGPFATDQVSWFAPVQKAA